MKKIISLALVLAMLLCVVPAFAVSAADDTVPGLTMNSYGMFAKTNGWQDSLIRFLGDPYGANYSASYDATQMFDQSIDEILGMSAKMTGEGTVDGFANFNAGYVEGKYQKDGIGNAHCSYLLHWTGTFTANQDVTFTPAAQKVDNGFVFFIGDSAKTLEKKYEYWGARYFDSGNETLEGNFGDITIKNGTEYTVEAWFMEAGGGEALVFGGVVGGEFKDISTFGTFSLNEEFYKFSADRWGNTDNATHPYVKAFMDALGDNYVGTGDWDDGQPHHGGNSGQCIPDNFNYDATIEGLLNASYKLGSGLVVPTITKYTAGFVDESYITVYDGSFTVEKTGNYLFGCLDVDNGLMIEIIDGSKTTRVFELWANRVWQDNDTESWYPTAIALEAGKTYKIHAAFLEMDGGQVCKPVVKYSETDSFDGAEAKAIADVLAFRTTIPAASDRLSVTEADKIYKSSYSVTDKVSEVTTNKETWGDGAVGNIFDGDLATKYGASGIAHTINFTTSDATKITHYGLITAADNDEFVRTPMRWTLLGSKDGVAYTVIDHVDRGNGGLGWFANELGMYEVDSPAEYKYYRFEFQTNFEGNDNDGAGSFAELLLYNVPASSAGFKITKNSKVSVSTGSSKDVAITANAAVDEVLFDGETLEDTAYTISADGKTVTLRGEFIAALEAGKYTVTLQSGEDKANATLTVKAPAATGDAAVIVIVAAAVIALAGVVIAAKKRAFQR